MLDATSLANDLWLANLGTGPVTPAMKGFCQGYVAMLQASVVNATVVGSAGTPGPIIANTSTVLSVTMSGDVMFGIAAPLMQMVDPVALKNFKTECDGIASYFSGPAIAGPFVVPVSHSYSGTGTAIPPAGGTVTGTANNLLSPGLIGIPVVPIAIDLIPLATTQISFYLTLITKTVSMAEVVFTLTALPQLPASTYTGPAVGVIL